MARCGRRTQWLSTALLAAGGAAIAASPPVPAPTVAAPPSPAAEVAADADLLLYLSEFEDAQGEWVDPAELPPAPTPGEDDDAP